MFKTIVHKELLENLLSYRFAVVLLLATVTVASSLFVMYRDYTLRLENYEMLRPEGKQPVAITPPSPLSIFARGLDENLGRPYEIQFGGQIQVGGKQQSVNRLFRLFATPDLLFVIRAILALAALLFAFSAVSGERENGTLKLILSGSTGRGVLLLGKWVGAYLSLAVPFLLILIAGTLAVSLSPLVQLNPTDWLRLGLFALGTLVYLAAFFSLGLLISALSHRSSSALVLSLFVWALLVFVVPNLGHILARQLVEVPSLQRVEVQRQQIWIKQIFDLNNSDHQPGREDMQRVLGEINTGNDRLAEDYRSRFDQLVDVTRGITRLSPAAAYSFYATDILGTGLGEERRFKQAVYRYKDQVWDQPINSAGQLQGEFPAFEYARTPVAEVLRSEGLLDLSLLALYGLIALAGAQLAFLRYDVR